MSNKACVVTINGKESKLNKFLNDKFPHMINALGENNLYNDIFSEEFKNAFGGDWQSPEFKNKYPNSINEQGEPRIIYNSDKPYYNTVYGTKLFVISDNNLSSRDKIEISNALLGNYLVNRNNDNPINYIKNTLENLIKDNKKLLNEVIKVELNKNATAKEKLFAKANKIKLQNKDRKLNNILNNKISLNILASTIKSYKEEVGEKYTEDLDVKEETSTTSIEDFVKESDQTSYSENIAKEVKRIMSIIPEQGIDENGIAYNTVNELTGLPLYKNSKEVENKIVDILANTIEEVVYDNEVYEDLYDKMLEKLKKNYSSDYTINAFVNSIEDYNSSLSEVNSTAFKIKFAQSFYLASNVYNITEATVTDGKFIIKYIDPKYTQDTASKLSNELANSFVNNVINSKLDLNTLEDTLIKIKKAKTIKGLRDNLLKLGINLRNGTLLDLLNNKESLYPESVLESTSKLEKSKVSPSLENLIDNLLNSEIASYKKRLDKKDKEDTTINIKGVKSFINNYKSSNKRSERVEMIKTLTDRRNKQFFQVIADYEKKYRTDLSDNSLYVGSNQRWMLSQMSKLKKEVLSWQLGDKHALASLKRKSKLGLYYVDYWLGKDIIEKENLPDDLQFTGDHLNIVKARLNDLRITHNTEIKIKNDPDIIEVNKVGEIDLHIDNIYKLFNLDDEIWGPIDKMRDSSKRSTAKVLAPFNFSADKSSSYILEGVPDLSQIRISLNDAGTIDNLGEYSDIFLNQFYGEYTKAVGQAKILYNYLKLEDDDLKYKFAMEKLIPDYHYKGKLIERNNLPTLEDIKKGTWHRLGFFNSITWNKENPDYLSIEDYLPISFLENNGDIKDKESFRTLIDNTVKETINKDVEKILSIPVSNRENRKDASIFSLNTNIRFLNNKEAPYRYALASLVNNLNMFEIFNGNISFYKQSGPSSDNNRLDMIDALKRGPEVLTDGSQLILRKGSDNGQEKENYKNIIGETIEYNKNTHIPIAILQNINNAISKHHKLISQATGKNLSYDHEIADAQAFTTIEHHLELIEDIWGATEYDKKIAKRLEDPNHKITDEDIKWLKLAGRSNAPTKFVGYSLINHNMELGGETTSMEFPMYLKNSIAVLAPAMIAGTDLEKLYNNMKTKGVKQVVFKSGSKDSNIAFTNIANYSKLEDENVFEGLKDDMDFNPILFPKKDLKLQVELPNKFDKEDAIGNQHTKNLIANFMKANNVSDPYNLDNTEKNYLLNGEPKTALEIYNEYEKAINDVLKYQLDSFIKNTELTFENGEVNFNESKFRNMMIQQLDSVKDADLIDVLSDETIPLEGVPGLAQRGFPIVSKHIHKKVGKVLTNTASVIQIANIGFDRISNEDLNQVIYLSEDRELRPPLPETDDKGNIKYYNSDYTDFKTTKSEEYNKMKIKNARIMLPFMSIYKQTGLSYSELQEKIKNDPNFISREVLEHVIGYRIPNQSISSNDALEIVGILPPTAGDSAIVYNEITAKTGSDFDIDKMYLMMPNIKVNYNKTTYKDAWEYLDNYGVTVNSAREDLEANGYDTTGVDVNNIKRLFIENILFNEESTDANRELFKKLRDKVKVNNIELEKDLNTKKGKQNQVIAVMKSILNSGITFDDLISPLDGDIMKDSINKIEYIKTLTPNQQKDFYSLVTEEMSEEQKEKGKIEQDKRIKEYHDSIVTSPLEQMGAYNLVKSRVDMLQAKQLVATTANHMSDISMSQISNMMLELDFGLGVRDFNRMFVLGQEGNNDMKITKMVSFLMNAAVDAAKDNFIIRGNFNTYTANGAMVMLRLGFHPDDVFSILMSDTVLELSKEKTYSTEKFSDYINENKQDVLNKLSREFLIKHKGEKINPKDFLNGKLSPEEIKGFWNLITIAGKELNNNILSSKFDSSGAGKNIYEHMVLFNRLERARVEYIKNAQDKDNSNYFGKLFKNGVDSDYIFELKEDVSDYTFLGSMMNNSLLLTNAIAKKMFLEASTGYVNTLNEITKYIGDPLSTSVDNIKMVSQNLYPYVISKFVKDSNNNKVYNLSKEDQNFLLNNFPNRILKLKKEFPDNKFLNELYIDPNSGIISFPNFKNYEPLQKAIIKEDAEVLYDMVDKNTGINTGINFIDNLAKYSYLTTGFKPTYFSMNEFLPKSYFINNYHALGIRKAIDAYNNTNEVSDNDIQNVLKLMAFNNSTNYKIVRSINKKNNIIEDGKLLNDSKISKYKDAEGRFNLFIRERNIDEDKLYMLTGLDLSGDKVLPRYRRVNTPSLITESREIRKIYNPNLISDLHFYYNNEIKIMDNSDANVSGLELSEMRSNNYISEFDKILDEQTLSILVPLQEGTGKLNIQSQTTPQQNQQLDLFNNSQELWNNNKELLESNGMNEESFNQMYNEFGEDFIKEYIKKCKR